MSSKIAEHLTRFELFKDLPKDVLDKLGGIIETVSIQKNDALFHQDDPGDALYLIQRGWVKIVNEAAKESEVVLNHIGPGGIIGEMAMIDQAPRSTGVIAISDLELLKLKSEDFLTLLNEQPAITIPMIRSVSKRLRFATTYIENAIEWSKRIASGDYNFAEERMKLVQSTIVDSKQPDEERANRFLGTFFRMVEEVRAREDELRKQLNQLKVEIDHAKRKKDVKELAESEFFINLKAKSELMKGKSNREQG